MGSDEIEKVKEYVYLGRMLNIYLNMYAEISWRMRSGSKAFTTIKDVFKAKMYKSQLANLFN